MPLCWNTLKRCCPARCLRRRFRQRDHRDAGLRGRSGMGRPDDRSRQSCRVLQFRTNRLVLRRSWTAGRRRGGAPDSEPHSRYSTQGYRTFRDPDGYPATAPPWGTLTAVDLNTGKFIWNIPFGEYPELAAKGLKDYGSENYGAGVVTASGIMMIASSIADPQFKVYDTKTGQTDLGDDTAVSRHRQPCDVYGGRPPVCGVRNQQRPRTQVGKQGIDAGGIRAAAIVACDLR